MCGIAALYVCESVPSISILDKMLTWCEKRGVDGSGYALIRKHSEHGWIVDDIYRTTRPYKEARIDMMAHAENHTPKIGDLYLMVSRASPETEPSTTNINMQPIHNEGCVIIHNGAVSQKIYNEMVEWTEGNEFEFTTEIDSEAIIAAYVKNGRNMKKTMEYLSGGFAFVMVDLKKGQMYVVNDFKPLATGYVKGTGYMVASDNDCLSDVVQELTDCSRTGMNVWEYYYNNPQKGPLIRMIDLESGFEQHIKFSPRYITSTWDSSKPRSKDELCLVSCSGGLDSSVTLATLKFAGYKNIIACHFDYGHRGSEAEKIAFHRVCNELEIESKVFDLGSFYKDIEAKSMLLDAGAVVRTGTDVALKTTEAWVPGRNMMFLTYMATLAESMVMKWNYRKVYLLGGFLNLAESGFYPDNCEDFIRSFLQTTKYGTLIGDRFEPLYCLANLMKSEQWMLVHALDIEEIIKHTISCDRPVVDCNGVPQNCMKNGLPACGSGLLSWWGAEMVGMKDPRRFYEIAEDYTPHHAKHLDTGVKKDLDIDKVVSRILLPDDKRENLIRKINDIEVMRRR